MPTITRAQLATMPKAVQDAVSAAESDADRERTERLYGTAVDPRMTLTERRYAAKLDADPQVLKWWFEPHTFKLGRRCGYTPDFYVVFRDGRDPEYHEVKGAQVWEDSRIKWKWAAETNQGYRFAWCVWKNGEWRVTYYEPLERGTK